MTNNSNRILLKTFKPKAQIIKMQIIIKVKKQNHLNMCNNNLILSKAKYLMMLNIKKSAKNHIKLQII